MSIDTQALTRAVECVSAFFLIGLLGYYLTKKGWFTHESGALLSRLVSAVIIPINLLYTINTSTTQEQFLPLLHYMFIPSGAILVTMLIAALAARWFRMARPHRNIFITASACSNTINIGLPVNLALFGTESLPAILIYYMGNTVVFWTIGNMLLASDAPDGERPPLLSKTTIRRVLPPPIIAFMTGLVLLVLDVRLPSILTLAGGQIGSMTTPLSIICIGIAIFLTGLGNIRLSRDVALTAIGRFVVSPLILVAFMLVFPVPPLMRDVFIIQASLPPMTNIALLAIGYKSDAGFASVVISFCTLCALVTVPLFMVLIRL